MNTKKVILGSLVLVFAIGSSIASGVLVNPVYVWAATTDVPSGECVAIDADCDNSPTGELCQVTVPTLQGNQSGPAYMPGCDNQFTHSLTNTSGEPIGKTIIELLPRE